MGNNKKEIKQHRKRLLKKFKILSDPGVTHLYIVKHGLYYRPDSCGYTERQTDAGVFEKNKYAADIMDADLVTVPVDNERHNKLIYEKIDFLKSNLIKIEDLKR